MAAPLALSAPVLAAGGDVGVAIAAIPVVGIGCLWLASRLRIPAILLLLPAGVLIGPVTGVLEPDELFGDTLFPAVSLGVAILLFEGGLGLRLDQVGGKRNVVVRLVTVGVGVTFLVGLAATNLLFDAPGAELAVLAGVLVVSGPTVVGPILRQVRPREPTRTILQWEGITIDPVGATLALVVLEVVTTQGEGPWDGVLDAVATGAVGTVVGFIGAFVLAFAIRRQQVPDHLQAAVTFGMLVLCYAVAEQLVDEGGLFAATVLGVVLANQRRVTVAHITAFNEVLGQLLLAALFIVLGAQVDLDTLGDVLVPTLALTAVLVVLARPLAVWLSTIGSDLPARDRAFMSWMAPRGIVAAATSALFSTQLEAAGIDGDVLAPATFLVIVLTVVLYGLTAGPVAKRLQMAKARPKGMALIGAPRWALGFANELFRNDVPVLVVTTDQVEAEEAALEGLLVFTGRLDREDLAEAVDAVGVHQVVAVANSEELNELGVERLADLVGRANLFLVQDRTGAGRSLPGGVRAVTARHPFADDLLREDLAALLDAGWRFTTVDTAAVTGDGRRIDPSQLVPLVHLADGRPPEVLTERTRKGVAGGRLIVLAAPGVHPD